MRGSDRGPSAQRPVRTVRQAKVPICRRGNDSATLYALRASACSRIRTNKGVMITVLPRKVWAGSRPFKQFWVRKAYTKAHRQGLPAGFQAGRFRDPGLPGTRGLPASSTVRGELAKFHLERLPPGARGGLFVGNPCFSSSGRRRPRGPTARHRSIPAVVCYEMWGGTTCM